MKLQLIFALAMVVLSAMADTKRSFNITEATAQPKVSPDQTRPARKPAYRTVTPEERKKLSFFPKNSIKFVATTEAPPKKIDNDLRRTQSVLLPKMQKQIQASLTNANIKVPFKATTIYNFQPTRAPKVERFTKKPQHATTVQNVSLKKYPNAYRKDLYKRIKSVSKKTNQPAFPTSEETRQENEPITINRKDTVRQDKNKGDDKEQDNFNSNEEEEVDDEKIESRDADQSMEAEPTIISQKIVKPGPKTVKIGNKEKTILKYAEENRSAEEADKEDQLIFVREKRYNLGQAEFSDDVEVNTEYFGEESHKIYKRSVIEEENVAPTVAAVKYTGKESTLRDNSNFRNINA